MTVFRIGEAAELLGVSTDTVRSWIDGSPRNTWPATVDGVERHGDNVRVLLTGELGEVVADVTPEAAAELGLAAGQPLWAVVKATETRAYPAE